MQFSAEQDPYQWVAHYRNKTALHQIEPSGKKNQYGDIDRDDLAAFEIIRKADSSQALLVVFNEGDKLIWRRRVDLKNQRCVHIVGKRNKDEEWIAVLFPAGNVEFAKKWDENSEWLNPPTLHPHEGEE